MGTYHPTRTGNTVPAAAVKQTRNPMTQRLEIKGVNHSTTKTKRRKLLPIPETPIDEPHTGNLMEENREDGSVHTLPTQSPSHQAISHQPQQNLLHPPLRQPLLTLRQPWTHSPLISFCR